MSHAHPHDQPFPKGALFAAAFFVGSTMVAATLVRTGVMPISASPELARRAEHLTPLKVRDLVFADRADGAVTITDVSTGRPAEIVARGSQSGFIRGVMRGLMRDRRLHGAARSAPFRLASWPDGGLSLTDRVTGRAVELNAFGGTNRAAFAVLLP